MFICISSVLFISFFLSLRMWDCFIYFSLCNSGRPSPNIYCIFSHHSLNHAINCNCILFVCYFITVLLYARKSIFQFFAKQCKGCNMISRRSQINLNEQIFRPIFINENCMFLFYKKKMNAGLFKNRTCYNFI